MPWLPVAQVLWGEISPTTLRVVVGGNARMHQGRQACRWIYRACSKGAEFELPSGTPFVFAEVYPLYWHSLFPGERAFL